MIHVALCSDNNYAMPAGVMIHSVCKHSGPVMFHVVVSKDFSLRNKKRLKSITDSFGAHIEFVQVNDDIVASFPVGKPGQASHITIASYYRLLLSQLLPDDLRRVIYLDCDLICLQSLQNLWGMDIDNYPLACVQDVPYDGKSESIRLGCGDSRYFNAGVLLINLDYWRENKVVDVFYDIICSRSGELKSHDQDILNIVFNDKVKFLPPKYNAVDLLFYKGKHDFPYSHEAVSEAIHSPVIVHFTYKKKPWIKGYGHTYEKAFLEYKKATPWRYTMLKMAKPDSVKGFISNILVFLGLRNYSNDYLKIG